MEFADLHFHSHHSDGKHSVAWLAQQLNGLQQEGLKLAVITDHDGVNSFSEFQQGSRGWWPSIRACELSCEHSFRSGKTTEIHLLIYGISQNDQFLKARFEKFKSEREDRFLRICQKLNEGGYPIDGKALVAKHRAVLGRPHIADALVDLGVVSDRRQAFDRFLYDGSPFYVRKWRMSLEEAVRHCRKEKYRCSVAHPGIYELGQAELQELKDLGVHAVEVVHPKHNQRAENFYRTQAEQFGLYCSGGSDFHDIQTDQIHGKPSLGRARYSYEEAKAFLAPFL